MVITFLELYLYKRIMLNGRERLVYTPEHTQQLIVGRNGSGKSSIMQCLIPRAQKPADYAKGGHYRLNFTHKHREYELSSTFVKGAHHSFQVDGEELNEGGTSKVQDELVRQHLGLDNEIIDLLLGETVFTQMAPMKRREWFMRLSNANLDYVLRIFRDARSKIGQTKGVVNHLKEKLASELQKLRDQTDLANLEVEIDELQKTVTILLREIDDSWSTDMTRDEFDFVLNQLIKRHNDLLTVDLSPPDGYQFDSTESIRDAMGQVRERRSEHQGRQKGISNEYQQLEKIIRAAQEGGAVSVASLEGELETLQAQEIRMTQAVTAAVAAIQADYPSFTYERPEGTVDELGDLSDHLLSLLPKLPNTDEAISYRQRVGQYEEQRDLRLQELTKTRNKYQRIRAQIDHHANCESVQCPKCHHNWKPGIDESIDEKLAKADKVLTKEIETIEAAIQACDKAIRENREKAQLLQRFVELGGQFPHHHSLWRLFRSEGLYHKDPLSHEGLVRKYQLLVQSDWEVLPIQRRIQEIVSVLEEVKRHRLDDQSVEGRITELNNQYADLESLIEAEDRTYQRLTAYERRVVGFLDGLTDIRTLKSQAYEIVQALCGAERTRRIEQLVKDHNLKLSFAHKALHEDQTIRRITEDLQTSLTEAERDLKAYQLLVKGLSPTEGVIADQVSGFIGQFCEQINDLLREIWTYELAVVPCHVQDGDLDYKFPLDVMNGAILTQDVKQGSAGQKEIVDLAFKMVAQLSLGLEGIPLLLDEPGQNLDPTHVGRLMNYIKQIVDGHVFPQLFMISHDLSGYGAMTHAQTLVLDKENITTLNDYNSHVDMQ